jgi:hypothetical protein
MLGYSALDFPGCCLRCYDCSDKCNPLQLTGEMVSRSDRRVIDTTTTVSTSSSQYGNGDEGCAEEDVEEDPHKGEDRDTSQKECEDHGETSVDNGSAGHALNSLLPFRDGAMA